MVFKTVNLLCLALALSAVAAIDNCFQSNPPYLNKVYNLPDYSGNYTIVTEYWMRLGSTCDFIVDTDTKLTWYSSDITVEY